jgi:hypothetical protein
MVAATMNFDFEEVAKEEYEEAEPVLKRKLSPASHIENKSTKDGDMDGDSISPVIAHRYRPSVALSAAERARRNINAKLANPLLGFTYAELRRKGRAYAYDHALAEADDVRALEIGACLAQDPEDLSHAKELGLTAEEFQVLEKEHSHRWSQPWSLYLVIVMCSICAAVQGMDETVVNGAQLFYAGQFGIGGEDPRSTWLVGLVNAAPYICCAFVGCWLTTPFNDWFGRRGTIFITCLFSAIACLWQGFVNVSPSNISTSTPLNTNLVH